MALCSRTSGRKLLAEKLPADEHAGARSERRPHAYHQAGCVIERQADVQTILLGQRSSALADRAGAGQVTAVRHHGRFRQTRGAGGEDVQRVVAERDFPGSVWIGRLLRRYWHRRDRLPSWEQGIPCVRHKQIVVTFVERQFRLDLVQRVTEFFAEDAGLGVGHRDAVFAAADRADWC